MKNDTPDSWLNPMLRKRPLEAIRVLSELIEAGLARGQVSANDISVYTCCPNSIGAAFKLLKRYGFVQTNERIKPDEKCKHGRLLFVWQLVDRSAAETFLDDCRKALMAREPSEGGAQMLLKM